MRDLLQDVYCDHRQGLFSLALATTGSRQLAEDAIQEAFASLVARQAPNGDLVPYVYKTVRHAAIDIQRARRRDQKTSDSLFNGHLPSRQPSDPAACVLTREREKLVRQAVDHLPGHEKEAVVLKAFAGLTYEQAGQVAGVSAKTIATRYRRALQKLEIRLRDQI